MRNFKRMPEQRVPAAMVVNPDATPAHVLESTPDVVTLRGVAWVGDWAGDHGTTPVRMHKLGKGA